MEFSTSQFVFTMSDFQGTRSDFAFIQHPLSKATPTKPRATEKSGPSNSTSQANFKFIHLDSSTGPTQDDTTKQVVRSHVMKGFQEWKNSRKDEEPRETTLKNVSSREKKGLVVDGYQKERSDVDKKDGAAKRMRVQEIEEDEATLYDISDPTLEITSISQTPKPRHPSIKTRSRTDRSKSSKKPALKPQPPIQEVEARTSHHDKSLTNFKHTNPYSTVDFSLPSPIRTAATHRFDPFASTPFPTTPILSPSRLQILIHHYNTNMSQTLLPLNPRNKWFSHALTDDALFHATLLHSSSHNALLSKSSDWEEIFALRRETIRIVNRRMECERERVSDVTIGAVACLALFENQSGNKEVSNIHMDGLQRMVEIRGGLENLALSGILKRLILWADITNALLTLSEPRFSPHLTSDQTTNPSSIPSPAPQHPRIPETCTCQARLTTHIAALSTLSALVSPSNQDGSISDAIYDLEFDLLSLARSCLPLPHSSPRPLEPHHHHPHLPHHPVHQKQTQLQTQEKDADIKKEKHEDQCKNKNMAISQAALIYIYLFLRECPVSAPVYAIVLNRLTSSIFADPSSDTQVSDPYPQQSDSEIWNKVTWEGQEKILLWICALGILVAESQEDGGEKEMLVDVARRVCAEIGVSDEEDFRGLLGGVAWMGDKDEVAGRIWGDIEGGVSGV